VALAAPLLAQMASGMGFLSGSFSILDQIVEVRSPFKLFTTTFGPVETAGYYSWLLLVAPALLAYYAYRVLRETVPTDIYFAVSVVFGIALLLDQMRLHYFGFFGLTTSGLLIVQQLRERHGWHRGATFAASLAVLVLAFQPALRTRLFVVYAPGGDPEYAAALPLFRDLAAQCAADPGVVLASADDGSPIVFHSACRVIANNFILRPEDKAHIDEIDRLMRLSPAQIQAERRDVKYMLVRARDFSEFHGGVGSLSRGSAIARELFLDPTPPAGYTLIDTVYRSAGSREPADIYARLYRVSVPSGAGG
jgi:hypothetical protein